MSRIEENRNIINTITEGVNEVPNGRYEDAVAFCLSSIYAILADISKSLAVIADKTESEE